MNEFARALEDVFFKNQPRVKTRQLGFPAAEKFRITVWEQT